VYDVIKRSGHCAVCFCEHGTQRQLRSAMIHKRHKCQGNWLVRFLSEHAGSPQPMLTSARMALRIYAIRAIRVYTSYVEQFRRML
jgi:hypothetical protein